MSEIADEQPFALQQQLLAEKLFVFLDPLHPLLRADVVRLLQEPGKLLAVATTNTASAGLPAGAWALLPLLVAQHSAPDINLSQATTTGVAVECLLCALDVLDDIEDGDQTAVVADLGPARVLNTATLLIALAFRAVRSLKQQGLPSERIFAMLNALDDALLSATTGQHQDLFSEQRPIGSLTQTEAEEIAAGKAGSLMQLACVLGVLCAGADAEQQALFSELGLLLGIMHQLDNDAHDLEHEVWSSHTSSQEAVAGIKKTDLARGKKTLPIILAQQEVAQEEAYASDSKKQEIPVRALEGGILATWGVCLYYRERARDCLHRIEAKRPTSPALRVLLGFA